MSGEDLTSLAALVKEAQLYIKQEATLKGAKYCFDFTKDEPIPSNRFRWRPIKRSSVSRSTFQRS